jgi:dienelactone hydrolase
MRSIFLLALMLVPLHLPAAVKGKAHANTKSLKLEGDLSVQMVAGIDRFLMRQTMEAAKRRPMFWKRDYRANDTYHFSVLKNRDHFRCCIGAVDELQSIKGLEYISTTTRSSLRYQDSTMTIHAVRWPVLHGVHGEGLLIRPRGAIRARVVAIPDADQTPEQLAGIAPGIEPKAQFARRLAAAGCQVVVPALISRSDEHSGNARVRFTNQPHREWIYRQAFQMGRHIIGYEVLKVQAIINWFAAENSKIPDPPAIGIAGYHEGGLIAFYAAALDQRIQATLVSGYFNERNRVWEEPIYRNVFGLLEQFGDAEIASLISPRSLVIEHSEIPEIKGPPTPRKGRSGGAAPGILKTPAFKTVNAEYKRAMKLAAKKTQMALVTADDDQALDTFGSDPALEALLRMLQVTPIEGWKSSPPPPKKLQLEVLPKRQQRQVAELVEYNQRLLRFSEYDRTDNFWRKLPTNDVNNWTAQCEPHRRRLWQNVIGQFPAANLPANPRSRKILETEKWICYEVVLDVWQDVFAWGYLLVPKDIRPGEKRPVVVCQHGLEGMPIDVVTRDEKERSFRYYKGFAAELADRGFVTFAPHNPYRGHDAFRVLQRKANPLGRSLFSVIIAQHNRIIDWLEGLPYVDSTRIGFYGLSYGGKTAMRVPALVPRYCLSICSADFNEWIKKNTTVDARYSYVFTGEYEMFEYNLGHTFNYAEMAALIAPRPFMVERGHKDGVAPDEWVAYEYAKVRRLYANLGIPKRTEIEYFNGPHSINGKATYEFLHRHLKWPKR